MKLAVAGAAVCSVLLLTTPAHAQPETRGTFAVAEWDAGSVSLAGAAIRVRVIHPETMPGPFPIVGVVHGNLRDGSYHVELARTLASRGIVALVPDIPCGIGGCNHDANANQLVALLEWGVEQSADATSMIAGEVDGERRGLIGHSWGALAAHLAAARDDRIDSVVLFDPNDDGTVGRDATTTIRAPVASLLAEVSGVCNSFWMEDAVYPMLTGPKLQLAVAGSGHCDPEEPSDGLCAVLCGAGDASTSVIFRRYAVAWTTCILNEDATVAEYVGGARMMEDETATRITGVMSESLATLPCRAGMPPASDAGVIPPDPDAGPTPPGMDAGPTPPGMDAGPTPPGRDAGPTPPRRDSGPTTPPDTEPGDSGCSCATVSDPASLILPGLLLLPLLRRRRR